MLTTPKAALLCATMLALAAPAARAAAPLAVVGKPDAARRISFEVALPLRNVQGLEALVAAQSDPASPNYHRFLSPKEFGLRFGPTDTAMQRVAGALRNRGLAVQLHTRGMHVTGTTRQIESAFATTLVVARSDRGHPVLAAARALTLPASLEAEHATVLSFATHEMHPDSRAVRSEAGLIDNRTGNNGTYWYTDLKQAYQYPSYETMVTVGGTTKRLDGTGVTLGVVMSSDALDSDIAAVFNHENWTATTGLPAPTIYARVPIDGGAPFDVNSGASFEAALDVQEETTGAPGAHVVLYNIPDLSDGNVFAGYTAVVESNAVDLVSSSFSGCELVYTKRYNNGQSLTGILNAYHELFLQGNAQGITFLASSGDQAGLACPTANYVLGKGSGRFIPSVSTPSNDPNVTGVGGTNVITDYQPGLLDSAYAGENAWSDPQYPYDIYGFGTGAVVRGGFWGAGSGASVIWGQPDYQKLVQTTIATRAVPDIGMQVGGCPGGSILNATNRCDGGGIAADGGGNVNRSAVAISFGGHFYGVIGTSVSSPELAGALALLIEQRGRQGNINPYLYKLAAKQAAGGRRVFHTGIPGYNGAVSSNVSPTYNLSTGVGTPIVKELVGALTAKDAGVPQTPSNP